MSVSRPVLVVAPPACAQELLLELAALGWQACVADNLAVAADQLRTRSFEVALLVLDSSHPEAPQQFEACVSAAGDCEWVGVFPPGEGSHSAWREHILAHFFDHHTYPADLTFLCRSLGHAWGRAALRAKHRSDSQGGGEMGMVGQSPPLQRLRAEVGKAGPSDAPVL
ncbi:MAG TPA: VpsR-related response regulator, partial [Ramlibacter sp.]|nr:VpsR-related response regulator [Ramlibacter sp.]